MVKLISNSICAYNERIGIGFSFDLRYLSKPHFILSLEGDLSSASILAYLVGMLPLTPGGLGFFDGTFGGILLLFNVDIGQGHFEIDSLKISLVEWEITIEMKFK